jgi:hypothetical protein
MSELLSERAESSVLSSETVPSSAFPARLGLEAAALAQPETALALWNFGPSQGGRLWLGLGIVI